jgi:hypothetical protein
MSVEAGPAKALLWMFGCVLGGPRSGVGKIGQHRLALCELRRRRRRRSNERPDESQPTRQRTDPRCEGFNPTRVEGSVGQGLRRQRGVEAARRAHKPRRFSHGRGDGGEQ